jgi:hypothetical protein
MVEEKTTDRTAVEMAVSKRRAEPVFVTAVRLRARRRILWLQSQSVPDVPRSFEEIDRALRDPAGFAAGEEVFYATDPEALCLGAEIAAAASELDAHPVWSRLRQMFALSDFEASLLAVALAADIDPALRRAYAAIHDDPHAQYATAWLVTQLFPEVEPVSLGPYSALLQWRLARVVETAANPWATHAPWVADSHIMLWLLSGPAPDGTLGMAVELLPKAVSAERICLYPELLTGMLEFARAAANALSLPDGPLSPMPALEIEIAGAPGAGKRTLAAQFAAALGADLLAVDAEQLLADASPAMTAERLVRAVRMARLSEAILYWRNGEGLSLRVWQAIGGYSGVMIFGGSGGSALAAKSPAARRSFELPALRREMRLRLWERFTSEPAPPVIENWILTPAEIARAARLAPAGPEAVAQVCRQNLSTAPGDLFTPLACPFTWQDIVLPPNVRDHLAELERQVRLRWSVYEEWGFERLCPLGRGITAMFAGPSGTGKTMAAQVMARSLDLTLLRVDLAGVMNKYIGETEKRLKQVFDVCERANVMLLFDEADALFGQRTQVKDAHDRFANIEIDYLLQRMEQFEGIAILATNRKGDLDKAFLRRLRFILDFFPPGPAERRALWQRALQARSPSGEEILEHMDWDFLANKLNMTGADIASAALSAAFLARGEGRRIHMHHILQASRREMAKHGVVVRPGEWEG